MRVCDLDVVTEDFIEADLERPNPGAFTFARLQRGDVLLAAVARVFERIQLSVVALLEGVTIVELRGRTFHERPAQLLTEIREQIEPLCGLFEQRRVFPPLETAQRPCDIGQSQHRIAQRTHLAWRRAPECGPAGQAFEIAHAVE